MLAFLLASLIQAPDSAAFVTRLGRDTLAAERWVRTGNVVSAEVMLRAPRTTYARYLMVLGNDGNVDHWEGTVWTGADTTAQPALREQVTMRGDSIIIARQRAGGVSQRSSSATSRTVLPFIDMVHWPYEVALVRMARAGADSVAQPLLTGGRASTFTLRRVAPMRVAIRHPSRGTMHADVDAQGRITSLDAAGTTRAVIVTRERWVDLPALAREFASRDAAGRSFGELSGRGGGEFTLDGVSVKLDYGTPVKRGRAIWGALVPWDRVWRTGANRATHFTTAGDLMIGDLRVPAGEYTLFSIPRADGGTLIINRQTGQNGQQYDPARDLGRVELRTATLAEPVEVFTISVEPRADGPALRLMWDTTELYVPVRAIR